MFKKLLVAAVCVLSLLCVLLAALSLHIRSVFIAYQEEVEDNPPKIVGEYDVGFTTVIYGDLNRPIGEELTIHGRSAKDLMWPNFIVDSVNGQKVDRLQIHVLGARAWPTGTAATIRGKEEARILQHYPGDWNSRRDDLSNNRQYVLCAFKPLQVIEPQGLALDGEQDKW